MNISKLALSKKAAYILGVATSAIFGTTALAQNLHLKLEVKPGRDTLVITPLQAETGQFGVTRSLPAHANGDQLHIVAKNSKGDIVHELRVPNHLNRRLESFDPKTGAIEQVQTVRQTHTFIDISLPFHQDISSLQILEHAAPTLAHPRAVRNARQVLQLNRTQISSLVEQSTRQRQMLPPPAALAAAPTVTTLLNNGSSASKMDFVFIGDGYTAAEMSKWHTDAQAIVNAFKADPLLAANLGKINIHRVDIASNQSGVDEIDRGIYRDTAMDGEFGCYNTARLLCVNTNKVFNLVGQVLAADAHEQIVVISNSTRYGGSGGEVATASMDPSSKEVALHEIGHSAFALADEYTDGTCNNSSEPTQGNVSRYGTRTNSKWGDLISASTPVPTQVGTLPNGTVGAFQGGNYCTSGIYRPTENSRMRTLGNPWHAVNTRLANQVFAKYSGAGTGNEITQTGNLGAGAIVKVPNTSPNYVQTGSGTFTLKLNGPSGTDFDLFLYKWNGSAWDQVAASDGSSSTENISYNGSAGYYYAAVKAYSGNGTYTVKYSFPPK